MIHVKKAFVIGHPIKHSRSPLIHGTWLAEHGIEGSYEAIDVAPEQLPAFIERLRQGEFAGGNVTIPHKEAVFALCDSVDPLAKTIGAANTLVRQPDGKLFGFNTDYMGFLGNLDQNAPGWDRARGRAIVLGAGGASRASLVVNTTSIGMHGSWFENLDLSLLPKSALVTDAVYVPLVTPLLADARALGLATVDGLGMLLHQAIPGFEAWFGVRPAVTPALRARIEATL
jgi:shikimate dehydrogenase